MGAFEVKYLLTQRMQMMTEPKYNFPERTPLDRKPWCFFGGATEDERKRQEAYLVHLAGREGVELDIDGQVFISEDATVEGKVKIGNRSFIAGEAQVAMEVTFGEHCTLNAGAVVRGKVTIGDGVRIASGAQIIGFNHGIDDLEKPIYQQAHTRVGIEIGDDVWVGANVIVVDGIKVGPHSILAAGAIVTRDVPPWSVVGGNPARVIKDRRAVKGKGVSKTGELWSTFKSCVVDETSQVLERYLEPETGIPQDVPGEKERLRPWCDMIEIAAMSGSEVPGWKKEVLIEKISGFQDPKTGLCVFPSEQSEDGSPILPEPKGYCNYEVMSVGYALECMGTHLKYPVAAARDLRHQALHEQLLQRRWIERAWGAGAWVDEYATAMAFNARYHDGASVLPDLFGWLDLHAAPDSGMWGYHRAEDGLLMPVNGFYRLTRGSYAQWGVNLPYPERAIDTILAHTLDQRHFGQGKATACYVLDIIHPLWLCLRQVDYRRKEAEAVAAHWLERMIGKWVNGQGFSFHTKDGAEPNLQGTEMWLSIVWLCADLLGLNTDSGYRPRGVHRTEVWVNGLGKV
jgi:acetyltransferase-like isoleucine patch superfamily enzyme